MNFYEKVYQLVRQIPAGKVATYGQLALMLGNPRGARVVGYAMRAGKATDVPWHRVLGKGGVLSVQRVTGSTLQRTLLDGEGVPFDELGAVNLALCRWDGQEFDG